MRFQAITRGPRKPKRSPGSSTTRRPTPAPRRAWADRPEVRREVAAQRQRRPTRFEPAARRCPTGWSSTVDAKVDEAYGLEPPRPRRDPLGIGWPAVAVGLGPRRGVRRDRDRGSASAAGAAARAFPRPRRSRSRPRPDPRRRPRARRYLDVSYGGVTFPNYRSSRSRRPERATTGSAAARRCTVFYRLPDGTPLSYTVFSGKAVPLPSNVKNVVFDGVPLHVLHDLVRPVGGHAGPLWPHVRAGREDEAERGAGARRGPGPRPAPGVSRRPAGRQPSGSSRAAICPRPRCSRLMIVPSRVPSARAASR